jgi:hypothetical protein
VFPTDDRVRAAENIEKEQGDKQRAHHAEIKSLKIEMEAHNSRLRMSEADLAKITDKLKKREIEVGFSNNSCVAVLMIFLSFSLC